MSAQNRQKHKLRRYLGLLRNAKNPAFIDLVVQNLSAELGSQIPIHKPDKILKLVHFLNNGVLRCQAEEIKSNEFSRLAISPALVPLLVQKLDNRENFERICAQIVQGLNQGLPKWAKKVAEYESMIYDLQDESSLAFRQLSIHDLMRSNSKNDAQSRVNILMTTCSALLKDDQRALGVVEENATKEGLSTVMDGNVNRGFKLSDFIDEQFLESCLAPVQNVTVSADELKTPVLQFLASIEGDSILEGNVNKRQKTTTAEAVPKYAILSPILSLLLNFTSGLNSEAWEVRQAAACGLSQMLEELSCKPKLPASLSYTIVEVLAEVQPSTSADGLQTPKYRIKETKEVPLSSLIQNVLPRVIVMMLKDQFSDYEDLNIRTPVRAQGGILIAKICKISEMLPDVSKDIDLLVSNLPQLLVACEHEWQAKLSFFLIISGLIDIHPFVKESFVSESANDCSKNTSQPSEGTQKHKTQAARYKTNIFEIFGRDMLIESLLSVEDSVRIIIVELISKFLDYYFKENAKGYITRILKNLCQTLKMTDDIEGSVIYVFDLINSILNSENFDHKTSKFQLDTDIFCPFNFHRVVSVRNTFNELIYKFLKLNHVGWSDLVKFHSITAQSLVMESDATLKATLTKNLKVIVQQLTRLNEAEYVKYLNFDLFAPQKFQHWLYQYQMTKEQFQYFLICESSCFESIEGDYYQLVYEPVSMLEKQEFYLAKLESCVQILAIIASYGGLSQYISQFLRLNQRPGKLTSSNVIELLVYERLTIMQAEMKKVKVELPVQMAQLPDFSLNDVLAPDHVRLPELQTLMQNIITKFQKSGRTDISDELDNCLMQMNQNILVSKQHFDSAMALILQLRNIKSGFNVLIQQLREEFQSLCVKHQDILDRFQVLAINLHLTGFQAGLHELHPKLNQIIHPLWNLIKEEREEYFQKAFVSVMVKQLLPALQHAKKLKPLGLVIGLILKSLEQESDQAVANEVRGSGHIIEQWILDDRAKAFRPCGSEVIIDYIRTPAANKLGEYINVAYSFLRKLNHHAEVSKENFKIAELPLIVANLPSLFNLPTNLVQNGEEIAYQASGQRCFLPELVCCLFDLATSQQDMQIDICCHMHTALEGKKELGFHSLKLLLQKCLTQTAKKSTDLIQYLAIFLLPVIKSVHLSKDIFSDGDEKLVMKILSNIIQLLPLSLNNQNDQILCKSRLGAQIKEGLEFMNIFTQNDSQVKSKFEIEIHPKTELRDYQRTGIEWMSKLGRYGLNCCLCDDMGLGKTIQSLTVILNESLYLERKQGYKPLSLVVCPNSLTYQWHKEIDKFFTGVKSAIFSSESSSEVLRQIQRKEVDIVISSYEKIRAAIAQLSSVEIFYLVLDEGHRIKNAKSKVTINIKQLKAERKLVLTGTPLQNKVSELWSIFDFLMPNFLEEYKVFNSRYNQFLTSNLNKLSEKLEDTQTFIQALKSLKKRISPFILRRTKSEVLKDLPPKEIQDFECVMPDMQEMIHSHIDRAYPITKATQGQRQEGAQDDGDHQSAAPQRGSQTLQNLIIHRKVCNHPLLVKDRLPNALRVQLERQCQGRANPGKDEVSGMIGCSGKLLGLVDLLKQSQIITEEDNEEAANARSKKAQEESQCEGLLSLVRNDEALQPAPASSPHRALLFCQMRSYLDMVVEQVLVPYGIKFTTLQAADSGQQRYDTVEQFNNDASIRILILTTAVGGLGLNLVGADTVIFMEHDWNPMKDMQAIDRAHRIGQKRTVNVYRLVLQDTLEQKIMSLQLFKRNLADNLIQSQKDLSIQAADQMQMHDLLACFEEHTIYDQTAQRNNQRAAGNEPRTGADLAFANDKAIDAATGAGVSQLLQRIDLEKE